MSNTFSKKHYEAVAQTIKKDRYFLYPSILTLAKMFKDDNPLFDGEKFFKACGFKDEDALMVAMHDLKS